MKRPLCTYCLFFVAIMFMWINIAGVPAFSLGELAGESVYITGKVSNKEFSEENQVIYLTDVAFCDNDFQNIQLNREKTESLGVICYLQSENMPIMGSYVKIRGIAQEFSQATNPGEFDVGEYYRIQGYYFRLQQGEILAVSTSGNIWRENLYQIRSYLSEKMEVILGESSGILNAMLLGDKTGMEEEIKELYQQNGIAHILAISGLHVSIIGMGIYKLLKKMTAPVWLCTLVSFSFLLNYVLMTGIGTSSLRAVIMFGFFLFSKYFRRTYDLLTAMAVSAVVIVIWNPYFLLNGGFWLSFLAVTGISVFSPALMFNISSENKRKEKIGKVILNSIGINYFTLPIILYFYYETPLYGFLLNLVVVPLMSVLLIMGIAALFAGCFWLSLGKLLAIPCRIILWLYEMLCLMATHLPFHNVVGGRLEAWQIALFYILSLVIICGKKKIRLPWRLGIMAVATFLLVLNIQKGVTITFLDVGQGDGICIEMEGGLVCMIDGGSTDKNSLATYQLEPFLKSEGIAKVDYWFVTHPDLDHYSGLRQILEEDHGIKIEHLVLPAAEGIWEDAASLIALAEEQSIEIIYMSAGDKLVFDEVEILCLHPTGGYQAEDKNEYSLMLSLHYGDFDALFTGDITAAAEAAVGNIPEVEWEVLKVAHHGSRYSSTEEFLSTVLPAIAVISCGEENLYGHPHEETLDRLRAVGSEVVTTPEYGAIIVEIGDKMGEEMVVRWWKNTQSPVK